jgi:hypothetical protein
MRNGIHYDVHFCVCACHQNQPSRVGRQALLPILGEKAEAPVSNDHDLS